ncbi:MAG: hypothetical protein E7270_04025 [Lachnospiraceae bacterium]|nr:hypothetical protein [Lachnospiraceae bacterium]
MKAGKIIGSLLGIGVVAGSIGGVAYYSKKSLNKSEELQGRYKSYYQLTNQWLVNKNEGKNVSEYFMVNDIKSVAIYGMGTLGELFYEELKKSDVKVEYFIDKNAEELYYGLDDIAIVGLDDIENQPKADVIVVTPVFDFESIEKDLQEITDIELVSLEDIIYGI